MNKQELKAKLLEQINNNSSGHLLRDMSNEKVRDAARTAGKFNKVQERLSRDRKAMSD